MAITTKELQKLPQKTAAWLLGISTRTLRDIADLERNSDGTYNAAEIVKWSRGRSTPAANLPDADFEKILVITEWMTPRSDNQIPAAVATAEDLHSRHGDGAFVAMMGVVLANWREHAEIEAAIENDPGRAAADARIEHEQAIRAAAIERLDIVTVCERCKKIRKGRKWVKGKPAADCYIQNGDCPECTKIYYR